MDLSVELSKTDNTVVSMDDLYKEYSRLVMGICMDILKDKEYAEDAFQSTFLKVIQNIDDFKDTPEMVKAKIVNTARVSAIDIYRKRKLVRYHEIPLLTEEESEGEQTFKGIPIDKLFEESFETEVLNRMERNEILISMEELNDRYRTFIKDYYFENLSISEIAEKHKITKEVVKQCLHRARKKLKKIIQRRIKNEQK
ncbi:MAG: sigma-70 family RNA polymerase sigma factor [Lachnospiraceae bacterium]|nr:sigma-70 family RNA polymerase sigma factor [Lachnospiraceae bacterium]